MRLSEEEEISLEGLLVMNRPISRSSSSSVLSLSRLIFHCPWAAPT